MNYELIHLEHETKIKPLGQDPDHCHRCACTARGHGELFEYELTSVYGRQIRHVVCRACGTLVEGA